MLTRAKPASSPTSDNSKLFAYEVCEFASSYWAFATLRLAASIPGYRAVSEPMAGVQGGRARLLRASHEDLREAVCAEMPTSSGARGDEDVSEARRAGEDRGHLRSVRGAVRQVRGNGLPYVDVHRSLAGDQGAQGDVPRPEMRKAPRGHLEVQHGAERPRRDGLRRARSAERFHVDRCRRQANDAGDTGLGADGAHHRWVEPGPGAVRTSLATRRWRP